LPRDGHDGVHIEGVAKEVQTPHDGGFVLSVIFGARLFLRVEVEGTGLPVREDGKLQPWKRFPRMVPKVGDRGRWTISACRAGVEAADARWQRARAEVKRRP